MVAYQHDYAPYKTVQNTHGLGEQVQPALAHDLHTHKKFLALKSGERRGSWGGGEGAFQHHSICQRTNNMQSVNLTQSEMQCSHANVCRDV